MKVSICLFVLIILSSCKKASEGISDCICMVKDTTDSIITITNPAFEIKNNQGFINYNCAEVEIAIASITDSAGDEVCENLVDVKCISNKTYSLKLASKLNYSSSKFKEINSTDESDKRFLMNELKANAKQIFELNINKQREIISIRKFEK